MRRQEAIGLLKELTHNGLIYPAFVFLHESSPGKFALGLKSDGCEEIKAYVTNLNLQVEDRGQGFCIVYR